MEKRLQKAVLEQKKQNEQTKLTILGTLGIPLGGQRLVEVPNRNSFVYVQLRSNQNEVIQAFNNKVAPSYGLPVIVQREGTRYIVLGVDSQRYQNNWNSFAPYLAKHGNTHSFDFTSGGGGDVVWVYSRQFMPLLTIPSGSIGGPNVVVSPHVLESVSGTWMYVGNTGTVSLLQYIPTGSNAVMVLVYLDRPSGNPYILVGSGSYFSNTITGTAEVTPYIPPVRNPLTDIPLSAIRLTTGTNTIGWDNIYDVRQYLQYITTGTGSGGGGGTSTTPDRFWTSGTNGVNPVRIINPTNPQAVGDYAVAIGQATVVSGTASFVWGATNFVQGNSSHAGGSNNRVFGNTSYAYGSLDVVSGTNSAVVAGALSHVVGNLSAIVGGSGNRLTGNNSVMLGGNGMNKSGDETVFVPNLNVRYIPSGTSITNIGIDSNGNIVSGTNVASQPTQQGITGIPVYKDGVFIATGTAIDFEENLYVSATGTSVFVRAPITTYFRVGQPTSLGGGFYQVPDRVYASGSLGVFLDGMVRVPVIDYMEQLWVSGTYQLFATGTTQVVYYGVPCSPQTQPATGTPIDMTYWLTDSDGTLMTDSDGTQLTDSDG